LGLRTARSGGYLAARAKQSPYAWPSISVSKRILWPATRCTVWICAVPQTSYPVLLASIRNGAQLEEYEIDLDGGASTQIVKPEEDATLAGYFPQAHRAAYYRSDQEGLKLWLAGVNGPPRLLISGNEFFRELQEAPALSIQYDSVEGTTLTGWVLLPLGYEPGRQYPLIVWLYPGIRYGAQGAGRREAERRVQRAQYADRSGRVTPLVRNSEHPAPYPPQASRCLQAQHRIVSLACGIQRDARNSTGVTLRRCDLHIELVETRRSASRRPAPWAHTGIPGYSQTISGYCRPGS